MAEGSVVESILVADCGTASTKVFLIDLVDGQYRFIAKGEAASTIAPPHHDVIVGVQRAIARLEEAVGRKLLTDEGDLIRPERAEGGGVDAFVALSSAGPPVRLALAGLAQGNSLSSAERISWGTPSRVVARIALGDSKTRPEEQIAALRTSAPEVVVITGGTDAGAVDALGNLADVVAMACSLVEREQRPEVVFCGNARARPLIAERLSSVAVVKPVDNVLPSLNVENPGPLLEELHRHYAERKLAHVPGFGRLTAWSSHPVRPSCEAFGTAVRFLARQYGLNVLGIDLGSASTVLASVLDNTFDVTVAAGIGIGHGAATALQTCGVERLTRWLGQGEDASAMEDAVWSKGIRPTTIGVTKADAQAELALARECMRLAAEHASERWIHGPSRPYPDLLPFWDLIVLSGATLASQPSLGRLALLLLDGLQPVGLSTLACDSASMLGALGTVASVNSLAAAQVLEHDALLNLGTLVSPVGLARDGERVMRAKLTHADGKEVKLDVAFGDIHVVPLPAGTRASLEMRPTHNFDIGWGRKGRGAVAEVEGGLLGLVIDARGRPLVLPEGEGARRAKIQEWRDLAGA